ncbi:MAG: carbohydrate-binding family 9-like protein [Phycisphaerales bacterium]|nr:MAG: carbohydrate-binding family 9-like protein [Phycisphaerales bacterium]
MSDRTLTLLCVVIPLFAGCDDPAANDAQPGEATLRPPRRYVCLRAGGTITIDGKLDDPAWEGAAWSDAFVDIQGPEMPPPRFTTRMKMLWDDAYLYVAARLDEPHVWGNLTERDEIVFYDNDFEIFIDPDGDTNEYYEIEINALNTIFDLFLVRTYINGGPALHDWDLKDMLHAVHIDGTLNDPSDVDKSWSVEFALPWDHLAPAAHMPTPPRDGDTWRINFSRVEWLHRVVAGRYEKIPDTPEDNWVWSPQGVINMHVPERWGYVTFSTRQE